VAKWTCPSTSRSTIHRALDTLEDANVVRKTDKRYALTGFGRTVTEWTRAYSTVLATALDLDEFLIAVESIDVDVPMEHFADAEVIQPEPREAHRGLKRIIDLIEASESLRMFSNILSPLYVDVARREMIDGTEIEVIFDERLVDIIRLEYVEDAIEAFRTGRFDIYVGPEIPFELFLRDDKMAMAAHDNSAVPRMFVETNADGAVEWAQELYLSDRERAELFDPATLLPESDAGVLPAGDN
jgi:predicted transcriptional regulator